MNRPLVWVAVAWAAGVGAAARGVLPGILVPFLLLMAGLVCLGMARRRAVLQPVGIALLFLGVGALLANARHTALPGDALARLSAPEDARWELEGRVRSARLLPVGEDYLRFVLDVDRATVAGRIHPVRGQTEVRWAGAARPLHADARVRVRGELVRALGTVNFNTDGFEDYLRRRGIHTALEARGARAVQVESEGRWWRPSHAASRLRQAQAEAFSQAVPESARPFVWTIWLGDSFRGDPAAYRAYVESGTAHILSVSGLHMGIVYASTTFLLRMWVRRARLRVLLAMGAVWVYALTAGAQVACLRSALMVTLYMAAELLDREPDAPTALSLSAIFFLLINPDLLFDTGFLLSFTSIASILLYAESIAARLDRLPYFLRMSFATTLAVQVLSLPVAANTFHVLPLAAPLANLIVVPLLSAVLWLTFAASVLAWASLDVAAVFGHALAPIIWLVEKMAALVSAPEASRLALVSPTLLALVLYGGAAIALYIALRPGRLRRRARVAFFILALATALAWTPRNREARVDFLDVGQGDASFIRTDGGATVLIDGGNATERWDVGERVVAPWLWAQGVKRLDCVVATHPDRDHIGGLPYIVDRFDVGIVLLPYRTKPDPREQPLLDVCARKGIPVRRLIRGDRIDLDEDARLEVLHPPPSWPESSSGNNRSLVLRLTWNGPPVLFPGDIQQEAEREVAARPCDAEVLKAPHHGSRTSSTPPFIDAVGPRHCIVSSGPRGEVADPDIMARYEAQNIHVWRTDTLGGIRLTRRGDRYDFEAARPARGYPVPVAGPSRPRQER